MDFARKQLEKYGWSEGQGLGKNQDGISKPVKPKLKFDNAGLGHNVYENVDGEWWHRLYNEAANNIVASERNEKIVLELRADPVDITNGKRKRSSGDKSKKYKGFIKVSELDGAKEKMVEGIQINYENEINTSKKESEMLGVTNEELFKICGGRTAHKGARHGLKMSAKLARIMEQERNQLMVTKRSDGDEYNNISGFSLDVKKLKKEKKKRKKTR